MCCICLSTHLVKILILRAKSKFKQSVENGHNHPCQFGQNWLILLCYFAICSIFLFSIGSVMVLSLYSAIKKLLLLHYCSCSQQKIKKIYQKIDAVKNNLTVRAS